MGFISLTHLQTALNKIKTMLNNKAELTDIPDKLPADGGNADTVNGHTVNANVPADAVFTDTTYKTVSQTEDGLMSAADKKKLDGVAEELNTHIADQVKHITAEERTAWNAVNYSNPNLLINPDFKINQRGETAWSIGTTPKYFVDRWYSARTNLSLSDDGLMLAWNGTDGSDSWIQEKVETKALFGKTVTISVNANDKIYTITDTIPETVNTSSHKAFTGTPLSISLTNHGGNTFAVVLNSTSTTPSLIRWIKCELGTIATPFIPPDPATELAKCQRYYQIRSTNDIDPVDLRPSMRATPTDIKKVTGGYVYVAEL